MFELLKFLGEFSATQQPNNSSTCCVRSEKRGEWQTVAKAFENLNFSHRILKLLRKKNFHFRFRKLQRGWQLNVTNLCNKRRQAFHRILIEIGIRIQLVIQGADKRLTDDKLLANHKFSGGNRKFFSLRLIDGLIYELRLLDGRNVSLL